MRTKKVPKNTKGKDSKRSSDLGKRPEKKLGKMGGKELNHWPKDAQKLNAKLDQMVAERTIELRALNRELSLKVNELEAKVFELQQTQNKLNQLASFPELNPLPIVEVNDDGSIQYLNPAAKKLFPDLQDMGHRHEWLVDLKSIGTLLKDQKKTSYGREVKVNGNWYHQSFHLTPGVDRIRIYSLDITELKQAEEKLKQGAEEWEVTFDSIKDLVSIHDKDFKIVKVNKAFVDTFGIKPKELLGKKCYEIFHGTEESWPNCPHKQTMGSKKPVTEEFWEPRLGRYLQVSVSPIVDDRDEVIGSAHIARDITKRRRAEEALEVSNRFLQIINKQTGMTSLLKEFLVEIRNLTGCSAVGVRLLDDAGNIPYQAYEGFSQEFYQKESPLSIKSDQCMCINVIKREIDPALPFYTAGGSFYINATSRFLATVSEKEKGKTRNECNRIGFESVALVPIPLGDSILGLIHVADPRENMVPLEMVELLERVSIQLGTGIHRVRAEEALQKAHNELEIRVQERTAELLSVVSALQDEMAERKQAEEALRKANYDLNERIKEINCLYSISYYVEKQYLLLEEKLKNIVDLIPSGCQYPEITCARIILEDKEYRTDNFKKTTWKQSSDIILRDEKIGTIEVFYLEKKPEDYEGPFLKEERGLINAIAIELREMTAHMRAEKALVEQSRILEAFFTSTITPFVLLDKNFNYVRVNEAYAKACQRDISEFPGHNHFEYYPSAAKTLFEHVVETKAPYQALARPFTFPDHPEWGVTYWNWTLTPILDSKGEVEFLVFSLQDVTERKRAQDAVEAERQRFNEVLEILPAYLVLLAPDYQVPFANRFFRERFGESQGRRCFEYLFDRSEPCETCESYTVLKTMAPHKWEWTGPDGRIYDVFDFPFTDTDGSTLILEMGIDITERKRAEEASRQAGLYARSLIEASLDPLVTISLDGKVMDVNKATELVTGVSREDLIGTDFSNYFTEPQKAKEGYQEVFLKGSVRDYPLAIRHTSGHLIDVLYHATVFKNEAGEVQGVFAAARDVTERKRMEEELRESGSRLRLLSSELLTVQEAERKRIAREIHDSIGQTLAAIKFGLESKLSQMGAGAPPPGVSIENIISLAQNGIEESRRIQMDLRPSILDDLGILATIGWFTREFQKVYSHISVEKQISVEENQIPDSLKTVLFRVMQEAMNNVAKHSKADLVRLTLKKMEGRIKLSIEDNGAGFDQESIKQGLGLTSMRERTELSGGTLEIESTVGKGTVIRARWPT